MSKKQESRLGAIYFMWAVEKKSIHEISVSFEIARNTVKRCLRSYRKNVGLAEQDRTDLITFYSHEMQELMARRKFTSGRNYLQYTDRVIELQDKIAGILGMASQRAVVETHEHTHLTIVVANRDKQIELNEGTHLLPDRATELRLQTSDLS